ncbi:MAG: hypothetical protein Kow0079_04430 [Vicingaceae bacterium]
MYIEKYGIKLIRLKEEHLELVRKWRNDTSINQYMDYKKKISKEEQIKWFKSIDNIYNSYYVIEYNNKLIGLINEKNIDYEEKSAEAGLFIWDKECVNSPVPLYASLCLLEIGFVIAKGEKCFIKVHRKNKNAIEYNKKMGFEFFQKINDDFDMYVLNKDGFENKVKKIIKAVLQLTGNKDLGSVTIEKYDFDYGIGHFTEKIIRESGLKFIKTKEGDNVKYSYNWRL